MSVSQVIPRAPAALVAALVMSALSIGPIAAADPPALGERAQSPVRGQVAKGAGSPLASQPTGRLIVQYRNDVAAGARVRTRSLVAAQFIERVALPNAELLDPAGDVFAAQARLAGLPEVLSVEPEYRRNIAAGPVNEPLLKDQWALHNTGQVVAGYPGVKDVDMNVPEAWDVTTGSSAIVVAVIDDGVDLSHPDLSARAWVNPGETSGNGIDDDANGYVDDVNGWDFCNDDNTVHDADDFHGTHVAASIAASGNGAGVAGVAPTVTIMALKFISDDPACSTDSQALAAIDYATSHGAHIVNMSWGGPDSTVQLAVAIDAANDTLFVAAAGNANVDTGSTPFYPASFGLSNILSVAAIHNEGFLTDSTNYGPTTVDLSAPGEDIMSALPGNAFGLMSGTSMAAANASGVAALAASSHAALASDGEALRVHLITTARALPSTLGWVRYPRLVDARAAVVNRPDIIRLSGADRFATSAAISAASFTPRVPYLFVAAGTTFPDALSGGAVAAQVGAPLLLVKAGSIPPPILTEIKRLRPYHIYVLGGAAAVSEAVRTKLASLDNPASAGPYRLAGTDRYATSVAISQSLFDPGGGTVFIANGTNFPDALAGVPAADVQDGPILLVKPGSIPPIIAQELRRLNPCSIFILGGTASVSDNVANELLSYAQCQVVRWAGADRYATASEIALRSFYSTLPGVAFIAAGHTFPDALSSGAVAGAYDSPLLLTKSTSLPQPTRTQLIDLAPARIFLLGGPSVIAESVVAEIRALFP